MNFGVGQISSLDKKELEELRQKIAEFMENSDRNDVDMMFFLLTNILEESSDMVFVGENAKELVEAAFGGEASENHIYLPGVVSRKKQFVPRVLGAIQQ